MPQQAETRSTTDDNVLRRYIASGDRDALGELIQRYAGMVYSTARRQVRDRDLAEDVMQNVFVTFARRAREIRSAAALGTWLLRTTRYASANAMKIESRRRTHEQAARLTRTEIADNSSPVEAAIADEQRQWNTIYPLLDEALSRLGSTDQAAVILKFLRGLSLREVGIATGTTEEGARKRVSRAVDRLRKQLIALGVHPASGGAAELTTILAARAIEPAPAAAISHATSVAASASTAHIAGGSLFRGVWAMATGTKLAVAVAVAGLILATGAGAVYFAMVSHQSSGPASTSISAPDVLAISMSNKLLALDSKTAFGNATPRGHILISLDQVNQLVRMANGVKAAPRITLPDQGDGKTQAVTFMPYVAAVDVKYVNGKKTITPQIKYADDGWSIDYFKVITSKDRMFVTVDVDIKQMNFIRFQTVTDPGDQTLSYQVPVEQISENRSRLTIPRDQSALLPVSDQLVAILTPEIIAKGR